MKGTGFTGCKNTLIPGEGTKDIPQGLKPGLILRHIRHS